MKASVIVVNKDGKDDLEDSLPTILSQSCSDYEVVLVDNDSADGSVDFVREQFPQVKVVENDENRWYAGGNNDGFAVASGDYVAILNPDVKVDHQWLEALIKPIEGGRADITTSKILYLDDQETVNACGNVAHYTGLGFCRGIGQRATDYEEETEVAAVSGCSFAASAELLSEIGGFDETFEFYYEDLDFSWRARLAGKNILFIPSSIVYHKYERPLPAWRFYNMERNRHLLLLKNLKYTTLSYFAPALLLTEVLIWGLALSKGPRHVYSKLAAYTWLVKHFELVRKKRKKTQAIRSRTDSEVLRLMTERIRVKRFGIPSIFTSLIEGILQTLYRIPYNKVVNEPESPPPHTSISSERWRD